MTDITQLSIPQLYEHAAMLLRRIDRARGIERQGWQQRLTDVTNEIVLRELQDAA